MMDGAALLRFRQRVQLVQEAFFPCTIRLSGSDVELLASTTGLRRSGSYPGRGGGYESEDDIKFRLRKDLLPAMPECTGRVYWVEQAQSFLIVHVSDGGVNDPAWVLGCKSTNEVELA